MIFLTDLWKHLCTTCVSVSFLEVYHRGAKQQERLQSKRHFSLTLCDPSDGWTHLGATCVFLLACLRCSIGVRGSRIVWAD